MAITKTDFINYTRCRRYPALENIRQDKLESNLTVEEYLKEENNELKNQIAVLSEEVSHKGADPEEIEKLNNKIASLEDELSKANKTSSEIMARANLIRNYVKENQVS